MLYVKIMGEKKQLPSERELFYLDKNRPYLMRKSVRNSKQPLLLLRMR